MRTWKHQLSLARLCLMKLRFIILLAILGVGLTGVFWWNGSKGYLINGSFEELQEMDRFGNPFSFWTGWVYEPPGRFGVGEVAHGGKRSFKLVGDHQGKVRLRSPRMKLAAGRYRLTYVMRGLGVGPGQWRRPLDLSLGYDNRFITLDRTGNFGWSPVTWVFDLARPVDNFQIFIGLLGGGWLWIDDMSLEKVSSDTPVTSAPVLGREESPIMPPSELAATAVHCPECGYRNNPEWRACYACGHPVEPVAGGASPPVKILADFGSGSPRPFTGGKVVAGGETGTGFGLAAQGVISTTAPQDWTGYDRFSFEVVNSGDSPAPLALEVRDALSKGYWTRVNRETVAPPGRSTVTLPTALYTGEKSRPGRLLERGKITGLFIDTKGRPLVFENFRLERLATEAVLFNGLKAFDFGPLDTPVMAGFQQVIAAMPYDPGRGFGWNGTVVWRSFNAMQPDSLFGDFVCPAQGSFRVDLPNGRYHVIMNIDSPGGYWGEVQAFHSRTVTANGAVVVAEKETLASFTNRYFRNARREDLPGIDTFAEYVQKMVTPKEFDVTVTDGRLELGFSGEGFAVSLASLVLYPVERGAEGRKFWDWVTGQRRAEFNNSFKQIIPTPTGKAAPKGGYRLFTRNISTPVNAFDGPRDGEELLPAGLSVALAPGEETPVAFSLHSGDTLGEIDLAISRLDFAGAPALKVQPIPASALNPGWLDYRIKRVTMDGAVYTVAPRYWRTLPAPAAPGVTRTFVVRVNVAQGTVPGPYQGTITVKPRIGTATTIPVTVRVLPFALDQITDVAVGPWGCGMVLPWRDNDQGRASWEWEMFGRSLDVIRQAGCTSFSGVPHVKVKAAHGRIELETARADREMALIRSKGFRMMVSSYGIQNMGYRLNGTARGPDGSGAKSGGFSDVRLFLDALYGALDAHAVANNWLPVAWNICDEPAAEAITGAVANARVHRSVGEKLQRTSFMGATSMVGDNPNDPHFPLLQALPVAALSNHDGASLKVVTDAGNKVAYYNAGSRWTVGRYLKMLVMKHGLSLRLLWHYNNVAGDPYYALDCREDDYCWYTTDASRTMIPSADLLLQLIPGLNDYRYLSTLQRLLDEHPNHPAAASSRRVLHEMIAVTAGKDHRPPLDPATYDRDRARIVAAILALVPK